MEKLLLSASVNPVLASMLVLSHDHKIRADEFVSLTEATEHPAAGLPSLQ